MQSPSRLEGLMQSWAQLHGCQQILCRDYLRHLSSFDLASARDAAHRMSIVAGEILKAEKELSPLLASSAV
jgi:hypothetical protein